MVEESTDGRLGKNTILPSEAINLGMHLTECQHRLRRQNTHIDREPSNTTRNTQVSET